jgi:Family of unknown function (DUF6502)
MVAKRSRRSLKRSPVEVLGPPTDTTLILGLLKELQHLVLDTAEELGVSRADRRRVIQHALKDPKRARPSETTMQSNLWVASILNRWRNDKRYRRPDGTPRVLSIEGKGATLQALARRYVPEMPLRAVVAMICGSAEVTRLKGNKIALIGSPVMMMQKTSEVTLAYLILGIRRLTETIIHNATIPPHETGGRFERVVFGELSDKEFQEFAQSARQPLQDVCDRMDQRLRSSTRVRARPPMKSCGLGLYVFKDDGNIG